jgi:tetratricopeptide (TPR) repeat protein
LRLTRDVFVIGTSLVIIFVFKHVIGVDFLSGWGDVFIGAALVLAVLAVIVGVFFRSVLLARILFFVGLTLVLIFVLGPEAFNRSGDIWIGAALVLLIVAVPVAAYLARPSVRAELPVVYHLWAASRDVVRADFAGAEEHFVKGLALADALRSNRDLSLGMVLNHGGAVYRTEGRLADAELAFKEALRHFDEARPSQPTHRATALLNLGAVHFTQGRLAEAEPLCREALALFEDNPETLRQFGATALLNLGQISSSHGNYEDAENLMQQALGLLAKELERGQPIVSYALANLADLYRRQGRVYEAEPLARRALAIYEKSLYGPEDPTLARFLNMLAEIVRLQGGLEEAESLCRRSQRLTEKAFGTEHIDLDGCLATLARIRMAQGRHADAEQLLRRCLSILEPVVVPEQRERVMRRDEYAALQRQMNGPGEASSGAEG